MNEQTELGLKFKVDDRELKKLGQTIPQAFDKKSIAEFQRAARDLEGEYAKLVKQAAQYTAQLRDVKRGTDAYKDLTRQLKDTRRETDLIAKSLGQVDRLLSRAQQRQKGGSGFGMGVAQGLGVAGYLPSGEGYGRTAGNMLARGARRAGGIAAAPFQMPGASGMAQGLSGIPIVGGFLAGALQQAIGAYQSAVGYDRAALGNIPYQSADAGRLVTVGANAKQIARVRAAENALAAARGQQRVAGNQRGPAALAARAQEQKVLARYRGQENVHRTLNKMRGMTGNYGGDAMGRRRAPGMGNRDTRAARRAVDVAVHKDKQAADTRLKAAQKELDAASAAAKGSVYRKSGLGSIGMGTLFGLDPTQTQGMLGQFYGAKGGQFNRGEFMGALAAKTLYGISMQQSGAFARGGIAGGGANMQGMTLSGVLTAAIDQKINRGQLSEYLQTLVGLQQQAEKMGVKINVRDYVRNAGFLKNLGLQGLQGQRVAGGLASAAMATSRQGVRGPMDVIMARAAGFDPSQGAEGYAMAMNKLAGGLSPDMLNNLISMVVSGAGGGGSFGPQMQALMVRRALAKLNVQVGPGQATAMIEAKKAGKTLSLDDIKAGSRADMIRKAQAAASRVAPTAVGAAGLAAERVGIGRAAAGWVQAFERNANQSAIIINNFNRDLKALAGLIKTVLTSAQGATKGGIAGIFDRFFSAALGLKPGAIGAMISGALHGSP